MNDEMILDISNFDFSLIDSEGAVEPQKQEKHGPMDFMDVVDDEDFDDFEEDEEGEDYEDEDEEEAPAVDDITGALSKLDSIPDDFELDFGTTKVAKGELVQLLGVREELNTARTAIEGFVGGLTAKEASINVALEVAKTETDRQLEHVYAVLNDPSKWHGNVDIAAMQKARIQLEARKTELDTKATEAKAAIAEQRQQAVVYNVQRVVREMGSQAPLTDAAKYAEAKGINLDAMIEGLSPALVEMMNNAKKYEDLLNKNKSRIQDVRKNKKPRSTSTKSGTGKGAASRKAAVLQAAANGKFDAAKMFEFLED